MTVGCCFSLILKYSCFGFAFGFGLVWFCLRQDLVTWTRLVSYSQISSSLPPNVELKACTTTSAKIFLLHFISFLLFLVMLGILCLPFKGSISYFYTIG